RHVQTPAGIQHGPSGQVRVADLDQVRLQGAQQVAPGGATHREAVTPGEGQGRGGNAIDAVVQAVAVARNQQAVLHAGVRAQAAVLGVQVSAYSAAGRRVEHRHVGDIDRKSTRLNSSHVKISYAVFC